MSLVSKQQWHLANELASGKASEKQFCDSLSTTLEEVRAYGLELLRKACEYQDAEAVEFGLYIGHRFGFTEAHLGTLMTLVRETWHTQHENIVDGLANLGSPSSVDTLYATALARFEYLNYDEAFALGVKCVWALGKIQAERAVARLGKLLSCGNTILEEKAADQLSRIEKHGKTEELRDAAKNALETRRSMRSER